MAKKTKKAKKKPPTRRKAIGDNPLDVLLGGAKAKAQGRTPSTPAKEKKPASIRATFHLEAELYEEIRNTVFHLQGPPVLLNMRTFAETAFRRELARLIKRHNGGAAFPERSAELRRGRPVG